MKKNRYLAVGRFGIVLCSALLGCTTCGQPSVSVGVSVSLPSVEIRSESDFYEPLAPYGEWVVVGSYGRCWRPEHMDRDWRPYCNGNWQETDDGWYWVSDEPWGWATYHYGRWNMSAEYGWYWVPQTQWAPAWVSWHSGGGYVGWAPMYPSDVRIISPDAYVFVEERHFMEPVRRSTVIVNNTTIINKTTVINKGPAAAQIERASGQKVQQVAVRDLRHKDEAAVAAKRGTPASTNEKKAQPPVRNEVQSPEQKTVVTHGPPPVEKPAAVTHETVAPAPNHHEVQGEKQQPAPTAPELKPETRPEGNHSPTVKEPTGQDASQRPAKQEKSAQPSDKKEQPPARDNPPANEQSGPNPGDQEHGNKGHE